jgi:hypothetical protein
MAGGAIRPLALIRGERSSDCGLDTEHCEEVLRYRNAGETLRLAASGELPIADTINAESRQIGERTVQFPEVRIMFDLRGGGIVAVGNEYQLSRIAKRERA